MKKISMFVVLLTLAVSGLFAQAWRGDNRLQGVVLEQGTGTPVKGAKVTLRIQRGGTGGPDVSTDEKGKWSFLGLAASGWNIDVEAPGYATRQLSVSIAEGQRIPPMKIEVEKLKVVEATPEVAAHEEVKIGGQEVPKEVAEAVEAGNNLLQQSKFPEAVAQYEKALPALPNFAPLKFALARAY
ncbi:MAG: carboxypeptidase-like regulatory domain-containing protein, partial [Acidobacteriota bacterium]